MADQTEEKEVWKSGVPGIVGIIKFNRHGEAVRERVRPGQVVQLTKEEREFNQEKASSPDLDVFKNGMLVPVKLFDTTAQAELAENPNLMAESDMEALFKANWKVFDAKVSAITNEIALNRLLAIAESQDATVRQVNTIQDRIKALQPAKEEPRENEREGAFKPMTPR